MVAGTDMARQAKEEGNGAGREASEGTPRGGQTLGQIFSAR